MFLARNSQNGHHKMLMLNWFLQGLGVLGLLKNMPNDVAQIYLESRFCVYEGITLRDGTLQPGLHVFLRASLGCSMG